MWIRPAIVTRTSLLTLLLLRSNFGHFNSKSDILLHQLCFQMTLYLINEWKKRAGGAQDPSAFLLGLESTRFSTREKEIIIEALDDWDVIMPTWFEVIDTEMPLKSHNFFPCLCRQFLLSFLKPPWKTEKLVQMVPKNLHWLLKTKFSRIFHSRNVVDSGKVASTPVV